jgi:hypothetical protein
MAALALAKWLKFTLDFDEPCYGPFFGVNQTGSAQWLVLRAFIMHQQTTPPRKCPGPAQRFDLETGL